MSEEPKISQLDLDLFKQSFDENLATTPRQVDGTSQVSLTGDEEITRQWEDIGIDRVQMFEDCLKKFTSAKNVSEQNKNGIKYVDDPMVNRDVIRGRYRQAFIQRVVQGDTATIIQRLRRGWIETIPETPADWKDARLESDKINVGVGRYFHFRFVGVNPERVETLAAGLSGASYTNPVVNGETLSGTFTNFVVSSTIADDGSGIIDIFMGDLDLQLTAFDYNGTPKESVVLYVFRYPAAHAQALINTWKTRYARGSGVVASYDSTNNYCDLILRSKKAQTHSSNSGVSAWNCRYKTTVEWLWGMTKDEANSKMNIEAPAQGIQVRIDGPREDSDGTFELWIYSTTRTMQDIPEYVSSLGFLSREKTSEYLGSPTGRNLSIPEASVQGVLYRKNIDKNEDCTYDERLLKDESVALKIGPVLIGSSLLGREQQTLYANSLSVIVSPIGVQGIVYGAVFRINEDGTYSGQMTQEESFPLTIGPVVTRQDALSTRRGTIYHASRSIVSAPEAIQGVMYDADNRVNQDGTYDGRIDDETSKEVLLSSKRVLDSALGTTRESMYFNIRSQPEAGVAVQGTIYRARSTMNRDGTYNGAEEQDTSKEVLVGPVVTGRRLSSSAYGKHDHNKRTLATLSRVRGYIYGGDFNLKDDGTYDVNTDIAIGHEVKFGPILIRSNSDEVAWLYDWRNAELFQVPDAARAMYDDNVSGAELNDFELYDSMRVVTFKKKPEGLNGTNSWFWTTQGPNLVYELPGGAILIMTQWYRTTVGYTELLESAMARVSTRTTGLPANTKIVNASISDPVLGIYKWHKVEWYKV